MSLTYKTVRIYGSLHLTDQQAVSENYQRQEGSWEKKSLPNETPNQKHAL